MLGMVATPLAELIEPAPAREPPMPEPVLLPAVEVLLDCLALVVMLALLPLVLPDTPAEPCVVALACCCELPLEPLAETDMAKPPEALWAEPLTPVAVAACAKPTVSNMEVRVNAFMGTFQDGMFESPKQKSPPTSLS